MFKKRIIANALLLLAIITMSGCAAVSYADNATLTAEEFNIKDGYYVSETDDSYFHIADGWIELKEYDISIVLPKKYEEAVEQGFIEPEKYSYEEFYKNSIEGFKYDSQPKKYTVKVFPNSYAMIVTESSETDKGGGSYSGYGIVNETTIEFQGNMYVYCGERINDN